jgi:hypothetical protein
MRLIPRPILTDRELAILESKIQRPTHRTQGVFQAYRNAAEMVRSAGRRGDKEAYDKACKRLEEERERVDSVTRHLGISTSTQEKD